MEKSRSQCQGQGQAETEDEKHLVHIPGANRVLISLTGKSFERALLWRLDWMTFLYSPPPFSSVFNSVWKGKNWKRKKN